MAQATDSDTHTLSPPCCGGHIGSFIFLCPTGRLIAMSFATADELSDLG